MRFRISFVTPRARVKKSRLSSSRMKVRERVLRTKSRIAPVFIRKARPFQKVKVMTVQWAMSSKDTTTFQLHGMAEALKRTESRLFLPVRCQDSLMTLLFASLLKVTHRFVALWHSLVSGDASNSPSSALGAGPSAGTYQRKRARSIMVNTSARMAMQNTPMHTKRQVADSMPRSTGPMMSLVTFTLFMTSCSVFRTITMVKSVSMFLRFLSSLIPKGPWGV
mmetsp:Transcript_9068/g.25335  ORF Transcript_9068/g.25335 Transcript_9068/m.25335 type:complete len:222 (+) Transcript_9068:543-1208(+)